MTSSLRDALRQSGALDNFKPPAREPRAPDAAPGKGRGRAKGNGKARPPRRGPQRDGAEIDLAKAYALRAQTEQRERERKLQLERETAERRRQQRQRILDLIDGKTLNAADAEVVRNFEYGGKIRRVYVTDAQLEQVNDGRLGVLQLRGSYLLVGRDLAEKVRAIDAGAIALLVDPADADADAHAPDASVAGTG